MYERHHNNVDCNFNPFTDKEDELHCILKFCIKHAEEYKLVQKSDNLKELDIQFKGANTITRHH